MSNVIYLLPFIKRNRPSYNHGEIVGCPECGSHDSFEFFSKKHIDGRIFITALICVSDDCDGYTLLELKDGVFI